MWGDCPVHETPMEIVEDEFGNEYESCPEPDCGYHVRENEDS